MSGRQSIEESPGQPPYAVAPDLLPGSVVSTVGYASPRVAPQLHRGLPSPFLTVIFSLDGPLVSGSTATQAQSDRAERTEVLVAGLHGAPTYVVQPTAELGLQLALHPLAARQLLGLPAARVPWQVTDGSDLLGAEVDRIRDQLLEETAWPGRFAIVAGYLRERQQRSTAAPIRPELSAAWSWLAERSGAANMDELARHVGLGPRQLRTLFARELGVGPKQVARLMRFDRARTRLAAATADGRDVRLADLAHACGYFDHAHLDADFRSFAGVSPLRWVAEERRNIQAHGHQSAAD